MNSLELLQAAREKVERYWVKAANGYGGFHLLSGEPMTCAIGAIGWEVTPGARHGRQLPTELPAEANLAEAINALWHEIPEEFQRERATAYPGIRAIDIEHYNDHYETMKEDVLDLYDRAIASLS